MLSIISQRSGVAPTIYLFVVDTCQDEDNLQALKVNSLLSLSLISLIISLSLSLSAGVSPAVPQSDPSYCPGWPHNIWKDGSAS